LIEVDNLSIVFGFGFYSKQAINIATKFSRKVGSHRVMSIIILRGSNYEFKRKHPPHHRSRNHLRNAKDLLNLIFFSTHLL
jgi:hypothetical protein